MSRALEHRHQGLRSHQEEPSWRDHHEPRPAPGKRSLVSRVYRAASGPEAPGPEATSALERAARTGGAPIPADLRAMLERALGVSLADVRLHADDASAEAAGAIAARAYTIGRDIHFARGAFAPDSSDGRRLIAHEVAHAVQHGPGARAAGGDLEVSQPGDAAEVEADRFADDFVSGTASGPPPARDGGVARAVVHRDPDPASENKAALEKIQGYAMFALLPALRDLTPAAAKSDEATGQLVGGPRLVLAQRAVRHGGAWLDFVNGQQQQLAGLWGDQVTDIMNFLGAPSGAAYYSADKFDGQFDGLVDPAAGTLTLYWRAKVQAGPGARFGATDPIPPPNQADPARQSQAQKAQQAQHEAWEAETRAAIAKFKADLPGAIQKTWRATIKPGKKIGELTALRCSVVATVVESGEHKVIHVLPDVPGARSRMGKKKGEDGTFREEANHEREGVVPVSDARGNKAGEMKVTQSGSAHEFGHAVGLDHPVCAGDADRCYGLMADEKSSVMGYGDQINQTKGGHSDFKPFIRVAEEWGKTVFPGPLAVHNKWSPG
jgi:hypothetical protein